MKITCTLSVFKFLKDDMIARGNIPNHEIFTQQWKQLRHKRQIETALFRTEKQTRQMCADRQTDTGPFIKAPGHLSRQVSLLVTDSEPFPTSEMQQPNDSCLVLDYRKWAKGSNSCSGHLPSVISCISLNLSLSPSLCNPFSPLPLCLLTSLPHPPLPPPLSPPPFLPFVPPLPLFLPLSFFMFIFYLYIFYCWGYYRCLPPPSPLIPSVQPLPNPPRSSPPYCLSLLLPPLSLFHLLSLSFSFWIFFWTCDFNDSGVKNHIHRIFMDLLKYYQA